MTGGPAGREGLVVGLADGQACRIFIDNPFPVTVFKHTSAIRCLDVSATRTNPIPNPIPNPNPNPIPNLNPNPNLTATATPSPNPNP